jgi:hypothetical protein
MVTSGVVVAVAAVNPADRRRVAALLDQCVRRGKLRVKRVVRNFQPIHDRQPFVEQLRQGAENARLGLAAQTEQQDVVLCQDGVDELRNDGRVVAD